ncbi:MAG TPA: MgtC/SapB family protein, partial [Methylophilaceae bacterium]|nr:MgtC/SapB family protein [Methylophilaceae bacterium]
CLLAKGRRMSIGQTIWNAISAEFSDIASVADVTRIILRLLLAAALGGLLGYDREKKGKAAGLRTHMLVALGAALFVLIPQQMAADVEAVSRILQGVIVGIGFLGAGAIIKVVEHEEASGLTTAAGIWLTAAIGVATGIGQESLAMPSTLLALIILALLPKITHIPEDHAE